MYMRKVFIITIIFIITLFAADFLVANYLWTDTKKTTQTNTSNKKEDNKILQKKKEKLLKQKRIREEAEINHKNIEEARKKTSLLKKKFSMRWLVQKGDNYFENRELRLALKEYLAAMKENPNSTMTIQKIADTYYEMKKYTIAYKYYKNIIWTDTADSNKIALSYINTVNIPKDKNIDLKPLQEEIKNFWLAKEDAFFYTNSLECIKDVDLCQKKFELYISQNKWTKNKHILSIKDAFKTYKSLISNEKYYKQTYFIWALFQNELYTISNFLWTQMLKDKPWYLPMLKIVAKWFFEVWNYESSKKYLLEYNKVDPTDPKVHYMLWIVNIKLNEHILSNIYFVKSRKYWFKPESAISKRLIYNYYLINDSKNMMKEFKHLIEETKDTTALDYSQAIYQSLINKKQIQANKWTDRALKLYPKDDIFYWYKWWIYKEVWDLKWAEEILLEWLAINAENPLINLNLWIIESEKEDFFKAKIYLKNTIKEDPNGDFWEAATEELLRIAKKEKAFEEELEETYSDEYID